MRTLDPRRWDRCCPETSVKNYHTTPRNILEERRSQNEEVLKIYSGKYERRVSLGGAQGGRFKNLGSRIWMIWLLLGAGVYVYLLFSITLPSARWAIRLQGVLQNVL
jgi:hypothetical protein